MRRPRVTWAAACLAVAGCLQAKEVRPIAPPSRFQALPPLPARLTLRDAEQYALANQPRLAASELLAQAEAERVKQARSAFFPQIQGNAVGVESKDDNNRLAAIGGISNPTILSRQSDGLTLSQLIADFGRTYFLTSSARARALSAEARAEADRQALIFRVDRAYFTVQGAAALLEVSNQTVQTRGLLLDRVRALAQGALRSSLDVSFEEVNEAQARLLQLQAKTRLEEANAELSSALGLAREVAFELTPQQLYLPPPDNPDALIADAFAHRPDLSAARDDRDAALRLAKGERAARFPAITAQGGYGVSPAHVEGALPPNYGAIGINVSVPIFTGGLLSSRDREAALRAQESQKALEDQETVAARDVYTAWADARNAYAAIDASERLLASSQQAYQLAKSRYEVGTSSIVELSQADLLQIQAQIGVATGRFDYEVRRRALDLQTGALALKKN